VHSQERKNILAKDALIAERAATTDLPLVRTALRLLVEVKYLMMVERYL
jgi:hypothetical protein